LALVALLTCGANPAWARWYKGNTHCHTSMSSDSETVPERLFSWYKANGYDFVVPTEHNRHRSQDEIAELEAFDEGLGRVAPLMDESFLIIPGEELTTQQHHINGLDLPALLSPASTISASFELIWANGGLPQLNHPEYNYLQVQQIVGELTELEGPMLLEVYNSHPIVVQRSGVSSEDIWDGVLSAGRKMWGVSVDDAHTLVGGDRPPGGGYIYVEAEELTKEDILQALTEGRFYASTGATLEHFGWTSEYYEVDAPGAQEIVFIGERGVQLARVTGDYASYTFRGDEGYVRARVRSPQGFAWTQPVYLGELPDNAPPVAALEATPTRGEAPLRVRFDARASSDPDGGVDEWRWDFGDGQSGRGEVISHTFDQPGVYEVALSVFDEEGSLDRATVQVTVLDPSEAPNNDPNNADNNSNNINNSNNSNNPNNNTDPNNNTNPNNNINSNNNTNSNNNDNLNNNTNPSNNSSNTPDNNSDNGSDEPPSSTQRSSQEGCAQGGSPRSSALWLTLGVVVWAWGRRRRQSLSKWGCRGRALP
jgi:PKD repeat protein